MICTATNCATFHHRKQPLLHQEKTQQATIWRAPSGRDRTLGPGLPRAQAVSPFYFASPAVAALSSPSSSLPPWLLLIEPSAVPTKLCSPPARPCSLIFAQANLVHLAGHSRRLRGYLSAPVQLAKGEQHCGIDRQRFSPLFAGQRAHAGSCWLRQCSVSVGLEWKWLKSVETLAQSVVKMPSSRIIGDAPNLQSLSLSMNKVGDWRALAIWSAACLYSLKGLMKWRCESGETLADYDQGGE